LTSANSGIGIDDLFKSIACKLLNINIEDLDKDNDITNVNTKEEIKNNINKNRPAYLNDSVKLDYKK